MPRRKSLLDPLGALTPSHKRARLSDDDASDDGVHGSDRDEENMDPAAGTPSKRPLRRAAARYVARISALGDGDEDVDEDEDEDESATPRRRRQRDGGDTATPKGSMRRFVKKPDDSLNQTTPSTPSRRRGRPKTLIHRVNPPDGPGSPSPRKNAATTASPRTPRTTGRTTNTADAITPRRRQAADRSARKKSMRALIEHVVGDGDEDDEGEAELARRIYESSSPEEEDEEGDGIPKQPNLGKDSKPITRRRRRSPTPPGNLSAHERFFYDMRPGRPRTGDATLAHVGIDLLSHEEFFSTLRAANAALASSTSTPGNHTAELAWLLDLHAQSFPQWAFELAEGFGVCLYGLGSKRAVVRRFAEYLSTHTSGKIVVVNGYVRTITPKDILLQLWVALHPGQKPPVSLSPHHISSSKKPTLLINSVDAPPMRRPALQSLLLALRPHIRLLCTADTPDFALLWDAGRRAALDLVFHDCTTLATSSAGTGAELDVVDEVHELLGRRARRAGGRDGVAFVLKSLPVKARKMFKLLVAEVLCALEEGDEGGENPSIEYRMVYNKAVEEFICGNEMGFRTLLKEFYDHQMIVSRTDALGTETLSVPFPKTELEAIFEDLCNEEGV